MQYSAPDPIIDDLEIMSRAVRYREWIYGQFCQYIGKRVVELGAGIGSFTRLLLNRELIVAVDNHNACIESLKNNFLDHKNVIPLKMDISSPQLSTLGDYRPDTCICINVLEHIKDDKAVISSIFDLLPKGGRVILLVPAYQFLYGSIDRIVGHHRRYSRNDLKLKLNEAGFRIREIYYMNSIAVIGWFLNNRVFKMQEESRSQVLFFDRYIVPWIKRIERIIRPPFGMSLIAIGEKERD